MLQLESQGTGTAGAAAPATGSAETAPVPITIVTGFLGAGKTTLVRNILTADHGYRIAVILNEFGEDIGIESSFVQSSEGLKTQEGEWVELTNGCMCCAVKSDFLQALESLLERPGGRRFDYILIETTGLANPGPIATALWTDAELESRVSLDGVVAVVDAVNIRQVAAGGPRVRQLGEQRSKGAVNEAQLQIAYADIVVLNKLDLASEEAVVRSEADIRAINSGVTVVRTQRSAVDLGLVLNRNGYRWGRGGRGGGRARRPGLQQVAEVVEAVYELYEIVSGPEWAAGEERVTRVVIIGRNLRTAAVRASWAAFVDTPAQ
ncbi:COBW domain-containing protein 1 [Tetrabaena socialis]|uniref:COBW domain-containing protein 1 n=1 Tax=Tetrabaena socialis TaxID=47790 RepID=A0A2J8A5C6_9CHLO|nr:COBW domain-containing protein 1 [Tetrabaena socialis]|eukprot:PNH07726.1 COBW domain-containing protein 1 [Tetrabaena socialis]